MKYYYENEFDANNNEVESNKYTPQGEVLKRFVKEYGEEGKIKKKITYDENGKVISEKDYEKEYSDGKADFTWSDALPYEGLGEVEHYASGEVKSWHYVNYEGIDVYQTYDVFGRIIERKLYRDEDWLDTYTWKFRDDGILLEEGHSTSRAIGFSFYKKTTYYRLDSYVNWIEKYTLDSEGGVTELALRDIEYF